MNCPINDDTISLENRIENCIQCDESCAKGLAFRELAQKMINEKNAEQIIKTIKEQAKAETLAEFMPQISVITEKMVQIADAIKKLGENVDKTAKRVEKIERSTK